MHIWTCTPTLIQCTRLFYHSGSWSIHTSKTNFQLQKIIFFSIHMMLKWISLKPLSGVDFLLHSPTIYSFFSGLDNFLGLTVSLIPSYFSCKNWRNSYLPTRLTPLTVYWIFLLLQTSIHSSFCPREALWAPLWAYLTSEVKWTIPLALNF